MHNNLENLLGQKSLSAKDIAELSPQAVIFRNYLRLVDTAGCLQDLTTMFLRFNYNVVLHDTYFGTEYLRLCERLAKKDLSDDDLMVGLALLAPVIQNVGWKIAVKEFLARKKAEKERQDKLNAEAQERMRIDAERLAKITKIDQGSDRFGVRELWVSESRQALEEEGKAQLERWHPSGYGTRVGLIAEEISGEHKGKFVCRFSRGTTSD